MNSKQLTFVIPSRNNLEFLKLSYASIKNLKGDHYVLILDDASIDGTQDWIKSQEDKNLLTYHNPGPERVGIVGMFDKGIEMAPTDIIVAFHADMVADPELDIELLKLVEPGTVVSATRVEPPLHPKGPEKITVDFGIESETFDLETWYTMSSTLKQDRVTEGIFAPWCLYKQDFFDVGGHDDLFAPQSKEDSDLFNRLVLNGCKVLQTWKGLVYHFTSRGSRFNKYSGGGPGQNSQEWIETTGRNGRNFIRKWGHFIKHDQFMKPIIPPKYNTQLILLNSNFSLLEILEPWFDTTIVDTPIVDQYIEKEQKNTKYNLRERVFEEDPKLNPDIIVTIDSTKTNDLEISYVTLLSEIIKNSGEEGRFNLGSIEITINKLQEYQNNFIKV